MAKYPTPGRDRKKNKPRSKYDVIRHERKRKRREQQEANVEAKRQRQRFENGEDEGDQRQQDGKGEDRGGPEIEYFGMLDEEEHEYFRRADELLANDYATADDPDMYRTPEQRQLFLDSVYRDARGKELKLACSQSHSRLMERLIMVSTTRQKKDLFNQFANHFVSLLQHRFASHCCETLFLHSAPVVTQELGGVNDVKLAMSGEEEAPAEPEQSMEELFLLTLDELEGHMSYLMTDRYASHSLRLLLLILAGRPLEDSKAKSLVRSKNKENITVPRATSLAKGETQQLRAVPKSFMSATRKIIAETTKGLADTNLKVLVQHPTGNPLLQLLLELDIWLTSKEPPQEGGAKARTLLQFILPGAPSTLNSADSKAFEFVMKNIYDPMGSRVVETIITHCSGAVFKSLQLNVFAPRLEGFLRNETSSYAIVRALQRYGKEDLRAAVEAALPLVPHLVEKGRFSVIRVILERCEAHGAVEDIRVITTALVDACGGAQALILRVCYIGSYGEEDNNVPPQYRPNKSAMAAHGAQLVSAMLSIQGPPRDAAQESLAQVSPENLFGLATKSLSSVTVLTTALSTPSLIPGFHKAIVSALLPRLGELASSQNGHNVVNALADMPSKGKDRSVPFHFKEEVATHLSTAPGLQDSWPGRSAARTWHLDWWKFRRQEWVKWAKEADGPLEEVAEKANKPWNKVKKKGRGPR